jgi:dethiobiotin synthetase
VPAVSPHRAARIEGRTVDAAALEAWVRGLSGDTVLVEGVGGWKVPIAESPMIWVADLAQWHGAPVVVVVADRLGCLNHALLTVDAVRADGLVVACVALVAAAPDPADVSRATNHEDLERLLDVPVVPVPRIDVGDPVARATVGRKVWAILEPEVMD